MTGARIHSDAFIHPDAFVCGDATLSARASVWPKAMLRADSAPIVVGESSNVQDGVVIHVDPELPCTIGPSPSPGPAGARRWIAKFDISPGSGGGGSCVLRSSILTRYEDGREANHEPATPPRRQRI